MEGELFLCQLSQLYQLCQQLFQPMKTAFSLFISVFIFLINGSASAQSIDTALIEFVQGDKIHAITRGTATITLDKKSFSIRFYNRRYDDEKEKYHAAQIAVLIKADNGVEE